MKLLKTLMIACIAATSAGTALAQTTAPTTVPHTFSAGTTASAAQVNDNFAALATAINNLADRVDALESPDVSISDLVGKTYCITSIGTISGQSNNNFARFSSYVSKATLMITSPTQASLTPVSGNEHELGWSVDGAGLHAELDQPSNSDSGETITINSLSDGVLSTSAGDLYLSRDGRVLLNTDFSFSSTQGEDSMAVGVLCK